MEKGKNRTDLLAAGRKKLQQFRQKKDHKTTNSSNSSQGKSSQKPGKHFEGREAEIGQEESSIDAELGKVSQTVNTVEVDTAIGEQAVLPVTKFLVALAEAGSGSAVREEQTPDAPVASSFARVADAKMEELNDCGDPPDPLSRDRSSGACQTSDQDADYSGTEQCNRSIDGGGENCEVVTSENVTGVASTSMAVGVKEDVPWTARVKLEVAEDKGALPLLEERANKADDEISTSEGFGICEDASATTHQGISTDQEDIQNLITENQRDEQFFASNNRIMDAEKTDEDTDASIKVGLDEVQVADTVQLAAEAVYKDELAAAYGEGTSLNECSESRSVAQDTTEREKEDTVVLASVKGLEKFVGQRTEGRDPCRLCTEKFCTGEGTPLTKLRSSVPRAGAWNMADTVEILQRHLYLATITEDFLHLQITEQIDKQRESELKLYDEVSRLEGLVLETQQKNSGIHEEFDRCRTELQFMVSDKKELEIHYLSARGEIEGLSARVLELQNEVKLSRNKSEKFSAEVGDCKSVAETLQIENSKLMAEILSGSEEIQRLKAEKEQSTVQVEELNARMHELQNELELSKKEYARLSVELADFKGLMMTLQVENSNLTVQVLSGIEDISRLKAEKDVFINENMMLVSSLSDQKDQLAVALDQVAELEGDFKETMVCVENLTEENVYLLSYLDIHKSKVKEVEYSFQELLVQAQEFESLAKKSLSCIMASNSANGDSCTRYCTCVGETVLEDPPLGLTPFQQVEENDANEPAIVDVLKGHLVEAEKMLQNLEKAILGMHAHQMALVKPGTRVANSGISKLIQAFESKAHSDNMVSDEVPLVEGEKSAASDSYSITKEQICNLRAIFKHIALDAEMMKALCQKEQDNMHIARKFEVECEALTLQNNKLHATIEELGTKLTEYNLGIDNLQSQLEDTWQNANEKTRRLSDLGESLQKEVNDMADAVIKEVNIMKDVISESCRKLDAYSGRMVVDNLDSDSQLTMSVNAVTKMIEDLREKLEAACLDCDRTHNSYDELHRNYVALCETRDLTNGTLYRTYSSIAKLIRDYSGHLQTPAVGSCEDSVELKVEGLQKLSIGDFEILIEQLNKLLNERCLLYSAKVELESEVALRNRDMEGLKEQCAMLTKSLDENNSTIDELRSLLMRSDQDFDELNKGCHELAQEVGNWEMNKYQIILPELVGNIETIVKSDKMEIGLIKQLLMHLGTLVTSLLQMYGEATEQLNLSKNCLLEAVFHSEYLGHGHSEALHLFIEQDIIPRIVELQEFKEKVNWLSSKSVQQENEVQILKESLGRVEEALENTRSELNSKVTELEQSEQRFSTVREKLGIAVSKGKGLVVQRDSLKQSLMDKSSELEVCLQELQSKEMRLFELEAKLKSSEVDRVEALESELSYIRNSATAFRDSFLQKDSVLQKIEEVIEELDLPEDFHSKDIVEKVEWLAKSVAENTSFQSTDWEQKCSLGGSQTDPGLEPTDAWKDGMQSATSRDELKRKYEELLNRFYGLAEQNDMLEQSLIERNDLVQRWENVLDKVDMPLQLKSTEPEDRLEWLGGRLLEVQQDRDSLLTKIDNLEVSTESLLSDLKASQEKISDLDAALVTIRRENEFLSENLAKLRSDHLEVSDRAAQSELGKDGLQKEIAFLQEKLTEKSECYVCSEIVIEMKKLHDLLGEALPDHNNPEIPSEDSGIKCLETSLRKLVDNYKSFSSEKHIIHDDASGVPNNMMLEKQNLREMLDDKEQSLMSLKAELDEVCGNLAVAEEERDTIIERCNMHISEMEALMLQKDTLEKEKETTLSKYQSLIPEFEAMITQRDMLQDQLNQEEQRSASMREKLNVAVRKGKGLVQQRDSLKQTVEEMKTEFNNLKEELNQRIETLQTENSLLKSTLAEYDNTLQDRSQTLNSLLTALHSIDLGTEANIVDPVKKLEWIGRLSDDLHAAVISSENQAIKSKKAAELLVAELNEVQERADSLHEYLEKAEAALAQYSKEKDIAVAEKRDAVSHLERFMIVHSGEMKQQLHSILELKDGIFELREGSLGLSKILANVLSRDVELFCSLKLSVESIMMLVDGTNSVDLPLLVPSDLLSRNMLTEDASFSARGSSEVDISGDVDDGLITEYIQVAGSSLNGCVKEFADLKEKLRAHTFTVEQQFKDLCQVLELTQSRIASRELSSKSLERDITHFEMIMKNKESELNVIHRNISLLYEACRRTILELETRRSQAVGKSGGLSLPSWVHEGGPVDGQTSFSEDFIRKVADYLLTTVKHSSDILEVVVEERQKELKATILDFQRELQERDVQQNRICAELVSQIQEAEAIAKKFSIDLDSAKVQVKKLESQVKEMENSQKLSELRIRELLNLEVSAKEYEQRLKSLMDSLAAKDQEIEGLMQALDEEESQMESLQSRNQELEQVVQQNGLALENLEASRAKALTKLSTTFTRFDELHHLSESLLVEIENLQSQVQERDSEISFLRQEVARCTDDVLAKQENNKRILTDIHEVQTWMDTMVLRLGGDEMHVDNPNSNKINPYIKYLNKQIPTVIAELEDLRIAAQKKDALLDIEKGRVNELSHRTKVLEISLREKESQIEPSEGVREHGKPLTANSPDYLEVEPTINKRSTLSSVVPLGRNGRRVNNDQIAVAIDLEQGENTLDDEDDDKAHGFKSLTTSRIVPTVTRPIADRIDGVWVSIERLLMRQPTLRLGIIIYWILLHSLLAASI